MPRPKKDIEETTDRLQIVVPIEQSQYIDQRVAAKGYGATKSGYIRDLILKDMKEHEDAENSNR